MCAWVAVGMIGGALIGGISQNQTNKANAKAAKNAGKVDITTTRTGDPRADPYRDAGAAAAYNALFPGRPLPTANTAGTPMPGPPGGGGGSGAGGIKSVNSASLPPGKRVNKAGKVVDVRNPAAPGGGTKTAGPAERKFDGMSQETADIRDRMATELPKANEALYGAGESYTRDTLEGNSRNPLIDRATTAADQIAEDERLSAFQDYLMGELGVGGKRNAAGGGGGTGGGGQGGKYVSYGYSNKAVPTGGGTKTTATGTDAALKKLVAGELPPGWQEAEDAIARRVGAERAASIRDLKARGVGSGFYGGSYYSDLEQGAIARGDQQLADELASERYGAFANALGLGTQYDLGMANIDANERSAAASAGAGARAQADALASQERMAKLGALGDMLGLGEQARFGKAGKLGDLAGLVSGDQRTALGGISDIAGGRRSDLGAAGELSLGADSNRNNFRASENQLAGVRAGVNLGRAELAFDKERFYDPLGRTAQYTDIINGTYGGFGSERTVGQDQRAGGGAGYSSPWGAAMTGAALGGQVGSAYGSTRRAPAGGSGGGGGGAW